jgi:Tol biopolymer transport system component
MDADGSNVKRLTVKGDLWSAAWSPDGRKLAVSDEGVYESDIWVITVDEGGSAPVHLAKDAKLPAWSPDGEQIAYVHTSGDDGYNQVYVMNADGTVARPLTVIDPGGIGGLAWSPDGKRIACSKCLAGSCDLYVMDAGGGLPRRIIGNAQSAAWSPDGSGSP